jgi:hypothetical protein
MKLTGILTDEGYKYSGVITYKDQIIEQSFFDGSNIYSYKLTGTFTVYKTQDVYIVVSSIVKQCGGSYVLIMDNTGNVLTTYSDVNIAFANEDKRDYSIYSVTGYPSGCMDDGASTFKQYQITGNQIIESIPENQ